MVVRVGAADTVAGKDVSIDVMREPRITRLELGRTSRALRPRYH
jgi:hypothetical protein